jgi:hypothetical protein
MTRRVLSSFSKLAIFIPLPYRGKPHQAVCHTERSPDVSESGRSRSADSHVGSPSTSLTDYVRYAQADGNAVQRHSADQELRSWLGVLLCVALFFFSACSSSKPYPVGSFTIDGVMHHTNLEGGCWVFRASNGQNYELTGDTAKDLLREGLRAEIVVKLRSDLKSICMVGKIVEVVEIKEIHSGSSPR